MMDAESSRHNMLESIMKDKSLELQNLPLEDLRKITNNFSDEQLLGEGGFGKVYKGVIHNGDTIAVKKLTSTMPGINDRQFENEVSLLMRLKHPNIVQLVGYCSETDNILAWYNGKYVYAEKSERLLCLEYLPKGSLREHLSDESSGFDWDTRYKIIEGICYGLHYLHEEWNNNTPIIHMDLKPSNILLNDNMVPKITDFGLSRLFGVDQTRTITESCNGTLGYMAPEYLKGHVITKKLDIFSLGVIIIEIMTGHKDYPYETEASEEFIELVLRNWIKRPEGPGYPSQKIDHYLQIRRCIQIALVCVKLDYKERPTTRQIIEMLHGSNCAECSDERNTSEEECIVEQLASSSERANVNALVSKLRSPDREERRSAAAELRLLAKGSINNQNCISEAGAIPLLLSLLSSFDLCTQEQAVPDEFRCPISLELMRDPVIVSTGQTFERACIENWIASGHHTCPTTQQRMVNTTLTPNYVLRSLIAQWCEANGMEAPKHSSKPNKPTSACSSSERANIDALLSKLCSPNPEEQRSAAAELRLLAKRSANNRICIAEAGAIPLLLSLLPSPDQRTQEHAVTALLNLSIHEGNKASIISSGAVPSIVHVLKYGSMETRENAAATLFSLSVFDEYKVTIGGTAAIPALVVLLSEGSQRGKKDAAAALFNLCLYQENKGRAIRAGLVPVIMGLLRNPTGALVDESLAILAILSNHPEGKAAIGAAEPVPVLVKMIGSGTPITRANAAAVMMQLCSSEHQVVHLARAQECGIMVPLRELALNGTDRGKMKAVQLLERISRFLVQQQEELEAQLQAWA
ncbi:hypothetical protein ACP4OV_023195 [Aristida adscensionis]